MKHLYFLFVLGLLCISKVGLYGQQKDFLRKVEAEIGVEGGFTTGDKTHSFSFMPRAGVELFYHWRLTFNYKLQEKANINYGITLGYAFGAGAKSSIR